jgi:hypothetical protein
MEWISASNQEERNRVKAGENNQRNRGDRK